jgi:hypothetical protein
MPEEDRDLSRSCSQRKGAVAREYRPFNITLTKERIDWKKVVRDWLKKQDPKNKQDHVFIARLGGSPTNILDCSIA